MPGWTRGSASTESTMDTAAGLSLPRLEELEAPPLSLAQLFWRRFRRHNMALVGVVVRAPGTRNLAIILQHILPNSVAPIVVAATLSVGNAILTESYISFLGLGVQPPTATWGNMLQGAHGYIEQAPWLWIFQQGPHLHRPGRWPRAGR